MNQRLPFLNVHSSFRVLRATIVAAAVVLISGCANMGNTPPDSGGLSSNPTDNQRAAQINTELGVGYMNEGHMDVAVEKMASDRQAIEHIRHRRARVPSAQKVGQAE